MTAFGVKTDFMRSGIVRGRLAGVKEEQSLSCANVFESLSAWPGCLCVCSCCQGLLPSAHEWPGRMNPLVAPWDRFNEDLVRHVHPADWVNPTPAPRYHLVVIGAGTAGLVTAAGAAGLGAKVALVGRHLLGGDCLNFGCVPSKTLIRSSRALPDVRRAAQFGRRVPTGATADFAAIMERVRAVRAGISPHDSARRFRDLGVDVFLGAARFKDSGSVEVGAATLRFKHAVIATGARAAEAD